MISDSHFSLIDALLDYAIYGRRSQLIDDAESIVQLNPNYTSRFFVITLLDWTVDPSTSIDIHAFIWYPLLSSIINSSQLSNIFLSTSDKLSFVESYTDEDVAELRKHILRFYRPFASLVRK